MHQLSSSHHHINDLCLDSVRSSHLNRVVSGQNVIPAHTVREETVSLPERRAICERKDDGTLTGKLDYFQSDDHSQSDKKGSQAGSESGTSQYRQIEIVHLQMFNLCCATRREKLRSTEGWTLRAASGL